MGALEVIVDNRSGMDLDTDRAGDLARGLLERLGLTGGELGLTFVPAAEMAGLNRDHMGKEGPTDVLSFPLDAGDGGGGEVPVLLGDVVVCPQEALERSQGDDIDAVVCLMVIHGILHVAGYDHERDQGEMLKLERELAGELCHG